MNFIFREDTWQAKSACALPPDGSVRSQWRNFGISRRINWTCQNIRRSTSLGRKVSSMLNISPISLPSDLQSRVLRERAERGHCVKSREFVASIDGEEAGLLSYEDWSNRKPGFIYEIFVLPSFRRRGVGNSLLAHAEIYARQIGCKSVRLKPYSLDQEPDQSQLIAWYAKAGYRQVPDDPEHMEKHLHAQSAA